ncbi:MAG TPA: GNAT family N-acetyltransferase [Candidatus Elarobacter sp.]|jgi:RimJ/RimL family protein N-acetyltransferase|nr:GNAT family N-acetyltransferase [Candidatus Elarobacter sp.]
MTAIAPCAPLPAAAAQRIRPFTTGDVPAYGALIAALSPADRRMRFHSAAGPPGPDELRTMLLGPHAADAVLAESADGALRGVAHAALGDTPKRAEFGIIVEAPFRRRGLGGAMTDALLRALAARGVVAVDAYTLWENVPAAALLRSRGFHGRHDGGGSVHWTLALRADYAASIIVVPRDAVRCVRA